jgi:hypothetical protein
MRSPHRPQKIFPLHHAAAPTHGHEDTDIIEEKKRSPGAEEDKKRPPGADETEPLPPVSTNPSAVGTSIFVAASGLVLSALAVPQGRWFVAILRACVVCTV